MTDKQTLAGQEKVRAIIVAAHKMRHGGRSPLEIAAALGISVEEVSEALTRGLALTRQEMARGAARLRALGYDEKKIAEIMLLPIEEVGALLAESEEGGTS